MSHLTRTLPALAVLAALLPAAAPAEAAIRTGTLVCDVAGGMGMVIASRKALSCNYDSLGGRRETYSGTISKYGLDIGATGPGTLVWGVFEPAITPGGLAGGYYGATAEATLGLGVGAHVLLGGNNGAVTLQPLSVQGQTGLNLAAGVGALSLTPVVMMAPAPVAALHHYRHHHKPVHHYHHKPVHHSKKPVHHK